MIKRIVKMEIRDEAVAEFLKIFREVKSYVMNAKGCSYLELWQSEASPSVFFTYSYWKDEASLNDYRHSEFFSGLWPKLKQLFAEKAQAWSVYVIDRSDESEVIFGSAGATLYEYIARRDFSGIALICDENTRRFCLPLIAEYLVEKPFHIIEIAAGEENKNIGTVQYIWRTMFENGLNRDSLIINLGGGVIGDMGGFSAATYMRGIRYLNIPTTLLSMIDASVGGKTGIDFDGMKNGIGAFRDPEISIIDTAFLNTLPGRQVKSGLAEAVKHGIISGTALYDMVMDAFIRPDIIDNEWIREIVEVKRKIVREDPGEKDLRKVLNLGHTIGHAIESCFLQTDRELLHGEAVALGIILENELSVCYGLMKRTTADKIRTDLLKQYHFPPVSIEDSEKLLQWILQDKKNRKDHINLVLARNFGEIERNYVVKTDAFRQTFHAVILDFNR